MKPPIIFDIDGTWDRFPNLWFRIAKDIELSKEATVIILTGSPQSEEKLARLGLTSFKVITRVPGCSKRETLLAHGFDLTNAIWIDNEPWLIAPEMSLNTQVNPDEL